MLFRFSCATFVGLAAVVGTDAFLAPQFGRTGRTVVWANDDYNDDFKNALNVGGSDEEVSDEPGSESSRFRAMKEAAAQAAQAKEARPVAIDNPFLTPPPPAIQPPVNPDELSVEEQARLFREMTQGAAAAPPPIPAPPQRVAKTDKAGRPQGRNRDADQIANTADVYFAQLKRDSTVRTMARIRGEDDKADAVFEDEGIEQLSNLLQTNPYLKSQREEEASLIDTVPEEVLAPYFDDKTGTEEQIASPGLKWKDMLKKKRGGKAPAAESAPTPPTPEPQAVVAPPPEPVVVPEPEPVVASPPEPVAVSEPEPVAAAQPEPEATQPAVPPPTAQQESATKSASTQRALSFTPAESRQKIRTLMGFMLKHRGGAGFGTGRLKGPEIGRFEDLLNEVTSMLRDEALGAAPTDAELTPVTAPVQPVAAAPAPAAPVVAAPPSGGADLTQVDGIIACIEGANTMFKNSPPELKPSVLISLRAALMAAVGTCNSILGDEFSLPPSGVPGDMSQIEGTIACIEGAITMYKNSPDMLKESVLGTLRAALVSAVNTCDSITSPEPAAPQQAAPVPPAPQQAAPVPPTPPQAQSVAPPQPAAPAPVAVEAPAEPAPATDPHSKKLNAIYDSLQAATGDGPLGLRSDLTSGEAAELEDKLMEMRSILMAELDAGIPDELEAGVTGPKPIAITESPTESSTVSKYQQMLAKAKAAKASAA